MRRPKKYEKGEGTQYVTRKQALKRLQLSLHDFRRLCIVKGIYPREPKHRRRAQRGSTDIKILYHAKDIKFLLHEPIVWTLRDYKIFARKSNRDRAIRDFMNLKRRINSYPELKLDHVVKERYPTFIDAIKDLDDCLTLLFLFSTFPSLKLIPRSQSALCRRLTIEFLHAIIASRCLSKVFISIKGYYFQAEIKGQTVTWIVPHYYPFKPESKSEVDFKIMSIFVEFYTIMLGFVNFRLYHSLNLIYPPQFPSGLLQDSDDTLKNESAFVSDRIAALNVDLMKTGDSIIAQANNDEEDDNVDLDLLDDNENSEKMQKLRQQAMEQKRLKKLFKGLKFFINREVPREPLVVIIRSFGGLVSWDRTMFPGATFNENDETITHQIVDRPSLEDKYISRDYIQPQWVFDSVNQRKLLPPSKYFIGAVLPPHLSPFVDPERDTYIPPEEKIIRDPKLAEKKENEDDEISDDDIEEEIAKTNENLDGQLEKAYQEEKADASDGGEDQDMNSGEEETNEDATLTDREKKRLELKKKMEVVPGATHKENRNLQRKFNIEEHKLKARMVKPRHRNLYRKLIREERDKEKEAWLLKKKRKRIEAANKEAKKQKKLEERKKLLGLN